MILQNIQNKKEVKPREDYLKAYNTRTGNLMDWFTDREVLIEMEKRLYRHRIQFVANEKRNEIGLVCSHDKDPQKMVQVGWKLDKLFLKISHIQIPEEEKKKMREK